MVNEAGVLKVCDFGLAGSMAESRSRHSRPGHTSGTTPYMSPQHLLLGSRTVSDDVYALGATLYELLTSKAPFYAGSIETQIERTTPPAIEERRTILRITGAEPVPPVWEAVIQSCLDKKSEARPASAGVVHHQLTRQPSAEEQKQAREAEAREKAAQIEKRLQQEHAAAEAKRQADEASARQEAILQRERAEALEKQVQEEQRKRLAAEAAAAKAILDSGVIGSSYSVTLPGAVKLSLCFCPAGSFTMGSPASEKDRRDNEDQVKVTLTQPFWLARTELTQAQWVALMESNPSLFKGDDLPVECVSAEDADAFIVKLNEKVPLRGWKWVLPTEAQWEYACRAGTTTPFSFGSTLNGKEANFNGNYPYGTSTEGPYLGEAKPVGSYSPNAWGLCDMHGNVWEWCRDLWDGSTKLLGGKNPLGMTGSDRVNRGGSWYDFGHGCRSAGRSGDDPGYRNFYLGFRLAAVPAGAE